MIRTLAVATLALGVGVLAGYALHNRALVQVLPGLQGMSPLTALALAALAAEALLQSFGRSRAPRAIAIGALLLGLGLLAMRTFGGGDGLSPAIAHAVFGYDRDLAGRVSPATAGCIVLLAAAALVRSRPRLADGLGAAALLVSGMAAIGYVYGVGDLYALPIFNTMALHTALAIVALSMVSLVMRPDAGWAAVITSKEQGGAATRRLLALIPLPAVVGALLLKATDAHRLGPGAAMAILVIVTIAPLALLILRDGEALNTIGRERRQTSDELHRRLSEQALALSTESAERIKAEAAVARAQRMETVGQLTGGIAHDFNNLLMAIGGNLQLLSTRLAEDHPARRYADNAALATDRGAKLTAQLLAFSRTQKLDIRPALLDPILLNARDILGNALGPTIAVEMTLGAEGGWASTDAAQLELAILNLAVNARDAMPAGGKLTVTSAQVRSKIAGEGLERTYLAIRVTDTGEGMTEEVAKQAVEPFFTTKERGKGTGLGLAQVYGFVRQCGGDLRILSQLGEGTTIELLLPEVSPPSTSAAEPAEVKVGTGARGGDGKLIVVIDDDDSVRAVLVDTLRAAGFEVVEATSGEEGLQRLGALQPAAAVIDFIMPGMNGAEVARRAQSLRPNLPIIFVSGYFDTVALDGISGAVVLRKPFDVEGLNQAVAAVLH